MKSKWRNYFLTRGYKYRWRIERPMRGNTDCLCIYLNVRPKRVFGVIFFKCHVCYNILFLETIKGLNVFIYDAVLNYRRSVIRISIELQLSSNPVHRKVRNYILYIIIYECKEFCWSYDFLFVLSTGFGCTADRWYWSLLFIQSCHIRGGFSEV